MLLLACQGTDPLTHLVAALVPPMGVEGTVGDKLLELDQSLKDFLELPRGFEFCQRTQERSRREGRPSKAYDRALHRSLMRCLADEV